MAAYEQREGSGSLFKNEEKKTDKHPDYRGDAKIGGKDYWLAGWVKSGKKGKFLSLAIQPKEDKSGEDDSDRDIPF